VNEVMIVEHYKCRIGLLDLLRAIVGLSCNCHCLPLCIPCKLGQRLLMAKCERTCPTFPPPMCT